MNSVSSRRITVLAAVAIALLAFAAAACGGSASPTATATPQPTQAPTATQQPAPTATPQPTATATTAPTPTPTPDPAMAAFLAAIEAGDPGPFPTGTFVREEISEGLIRLTFSSEGMVNMNGVVQRRFTSTDDILVLVVGGEDPYCDSTPDTYEWSFDGSELVFKGVGAQTCPDDSRFLELIPWHRP